MAMIKCPECGKEISDAAKMCPNCGYKARKHKKILRIIAIIFIIIVALLVSLVLIGKSRQYRTKINQLPLEYIGKNIEDVPKDHLTGEYENTIIFDDEQRVTYELDDMAFIGGVVVPSVDIYFKKDSGEITSVRWSSGLGNRKEMGERLVIGAQKKYGKYDLESYDPNTILGEAYYYSWKDKKGYNISVNNGQMGGDTWSCNIIWEKAD